MHHWITILNISFLLFTHASVLFGKSKRKKQRRWSRNLMPFGAVFLSQITAFKLRMQGFHASSCHYVFKPGEQF